VDASSASWLVIAFAVTAANLPFFNEKLFGVIPLGSSRQGTERTKHFALRLLELLVLYFVVGVLGYALEARIGSVFAHTWEFYAITACLFIVLAFPGFVLRYLRKRRNGN
jgi:ABC-type Na+ efflux pump permease subunit